MTELTVRNLRPDEEEKHLEMLNICYDYWGDRKKYQRYYKSEIATTSLVVEEKEKWVGGVTSWFLDAFLKGERRTKVYISGDAYVHPLYRGKGVYKTFRQNADKMAQEKGAILGMAFTSIFNTPFFALQKYGFIDIFHPTTSILVLRPQRYFDFLVEQLKDFELPRKLEGKTIELTIRLKSLKGEQEVSGVLHVSNAKLEKVTPDKRQGCCKPKTDVRVSVDLETLEKIFRLFHLRKRYRFLSVLLDIGRRRIKLQLSVSFLRGIVGL